MLRIDEVAASSEDATLTVAVRYTVLETQQAGAGPVHAEPRIMSTQQYLCRIRAALPPLRAAAQELPPRWFNGIEYPGGDHGEPRLVLPLRA